MKERLGFAETGPFFCLYQVSASPVYSFCPDVFSFTFLIYTIKITTAVTKANPSETGMLIHTPFTPYKGGSRSNPGSRYTNWRESDRKILILAIPILWKKFDITICAPTNGNINVQMRSPDDAMSIN